MKPRKGQGLPIVTPLMADLGLEPGLLTTTHQSPWLAPSPCFTPPGVWGTELGATPTPCSTLTGWIWEAPSLTTGQAPGGE